MAVTSDRPAQSADSGRYADVLPSGARQRVRLGRCSRGASRSVRGSASAGASDAPAIIDLTTLEVHQLVATMYDVISPLPQILAQVGRYNAADSAARDLAAAESWPGT